jgi:hypothetical protein
MLTVMFQLVDGLMDISQGGMALLLFERVVYLWTPAFGQLF